MRCDDQPNGCGPCISNQTACKTTDRITGKATVRGYVQSLEKQLQDLQGRTQELENRLLALGADIAPLPETRHATIASSVQTFGDSSSKHDRLGVEKGPETSVPNGSAQEVYKKTDGHAEEGRTPGLPNFRAGLAGNNYLGVSTGNSLLSSIRGTSMSVLGIEIDLADYMSADVDEPDVSRANTQPVYNKSYRAFVQTAFGTSPKLNKVELPPRSEGMNYAHVYFRVINPYLPIVHKPSFMTTVSLRSPLSSFYPVLTHSSLHNVMTILHSSPQ